MPAIYLRAARGQIRGYGVGQREIDVVAAEQNMIADCYALELQFVLRVR